MTVHRCILPNWRKDEEPQLSRVKEGIFSAEYLKKLNEEFYNIYFLPNYPSTYTPGNTVDGSQIDTFEYVYVDMDLKSGIWKFKEEFINFVNENLPRPTKVVDSGNGIHVYWRVLDLDAMSYLRLQRRLLRKYRTDEAVGQIYQLMRVPGTINTKNPDDLKFCDLIQESDSQYTCEQLDGLLPIIAEEDEKYCQQHYNKTYRLAEATEITDSLPAKFSELIAANQEAKAIWAGTREGDRSTGDYRLAHIMLASGFKRDEALSVLVNSAKAMERAPHHRHTYAINIVDKIWTQTSDPLALSQSVSEILRKHGSEIKGTRFPCWPYIDATEHGFRLGQIIGLVAGSGVGKSTVALNMFAGFVQNNPEYEHFFVSLEQPSNEIAERWKIMCGDNESMHDKVHIISNYGDTGNFRNLALGSIKDYLMKFKETTGKRIGCVVIDHINALAKITKNGENQGLMDICKEMKGFAVQLDTMLVMQSQAPREKAGIGDLELNKDAAYGTVLFESFCDYLVTLWQPLKRCYQEDGCPTVMAFKFCKIRHKKQGYDKLQEDTRYTLYFDVLNQRLRPMTQTENQSFDFFNTRATSKRKQDNKTEVLTYKSTEWTANAKDSSNKNVIAIGRTQTSN